MTLAFLLAVHQINLSFWKAEVEIPCKDEYKEKPVILQFSGYAPFFLLHDFLSEVLVLKQKHWDIYTGIVHLEVCHDASLSHQHYAMVGTQTAGAVYLFSEVKEKRIRKNLK